MQNILLALHSLIALGLVGVVLMQRSEGGGLGIGGSSGGGFMSARGKANFLTRLTSWLAAAFMVSSLVLGIIAGQTKSNTSIFDNNSFLNENAGQVAPAPASGEAAPVENAKPENSDSTVPVGQ